MAVHSSTMKLRLFIDGAARGNPGPAAIGIVVQDGRGRKVAEVSEFLGHATNNVAEYRALLRALREAQSRGADELEIRTDSDLLVKQINGQYRVKSPHLIPLHDEALQALGMFRRWSITHVPRRANAAADTLANKAIDAAVQSSSKRASGRASSGRPSSSRASSNRVSSNPGPAGSRLATLALSNHGRIGTVDRPALAGREDLEIELQSLADSLDGIIGIGVKPTWDGRTIFIEPDRRFPMASVFKIPVLVELVLQAEEERLRLDETVKVTEALKSPGSGVLKELTSEPTLSLTDLAMLMIIISDNTATDILVDRVGASAINRRLASMGLGITQVVMTCRQLLFEIAGRPSGPFTPEARLEVERILKTRERVFTGRAYADTDNNVTTPREMIALLEMLVTDGRLPAGAREQALHFMRRQQIRDRLPFHLPPGTEMAHKTGSIAGVRNDAGILFLPRGPVLVCAFTRDLREDQAGTAAIAEVGRLVYEAYQ
ncbi:MAG: serine hydrolase [Armatimonadota bacterium]